MKTGNHQLIYRNYKCDTFWGSCYCPKHKIINNDSKKGLGLNKLGKILQEVRDKVKNEHRQKWISLIEFTRDENCDNDVIYDKEKYHSAESATNSDDEEDYPIFDTDTPENELIENKTYTKLKRKNKLRAKKIQSEKKKTHHSKNSQSKDVNLSKDVNSIIKPCSVVLTKCRYNANTININNEKHGNNDVNNGNNDVHDVNDLNQTIKEELLSSDENVNESKSDEDEDVNIDDDLEGFEAGDVAIFMK